MLSELRLKRMPNLLIKIYFDFGTNQNYWSDQSQFLTLRASTVVRLLIINRTFFRYYKARNIQ